MCLRVRIKAHKRTDFHLMVRKLLKMIEEEELNIYNIKWNVLIEY